MLLRTSNVELFALLKASRSIQMSGKICRLYATGDKKRIGVIQVHSDPYTTLDNLSQNVSAFLRDEIDRAELARRFKKTAITFAPQDVVVEVHQGYVLTEAKYGRSKRKLKLVVPTIFDLEADYRDAHSGT